MDLPFCTLFLGRRERQSLGNAVPCPVLAGAAVITVLRAIKALCIFSANLLDSAAAVPKAQGRRLRSSLSLGM